MIIDRKRFVAQGKGKIMQNYEFLDKIGAGSYGEVWKAKFKPTGDIRAIKKIAKSGEQVGNLTSIVSELEILKELDHPNIVRVFEYYQDSKYFYLVTEFFNGGELFDLLK